MAWDPELYQKFLAERLLPFNDLKDLGHFRPGMRIVDLGCGTGELTARLAELSPGAEVLGIDNSASMLSRAVPQPGLRFAEATIEAYKPESAVDMLFSHAALHWVEDHPALFRRLASLLRPGGQLLVQMPSNHDHISQRLARELAQESPWRDRLDGFVRLSPVQSIDAYAELVHACGLSRPTVIEKVYGHVLPDAHAVLEWVRGTTLVPYLERLSAAHSAEFLDALDVRYAAAMPARPYYFAFKRILIAATLGGP